MAVRIEREGSGHVLAVSGAMVFAEVIDAIERVEADDNGNEFVVTVFGADASLDLTLDELHAVARRLRGSTRRSRRNALVVDGAGVGQTIADFETMVSTLSDSWNGSPLELATFSDRDEAIRWASEPPA